MLFSFLPLRLKLFQEANITDKIDRKGHFVLLSFLSLRLKFFQEANITAKIDRKGGGTGPGGSCGENSTDGPDLEVYLVRQPAPELIRSFRIVLIDAKTHVDR